MYRINRGRYGPIHGEKGACGMKGGTGGWKFGKIKKAPTEKDYKKTHSKAPFVNNQKNGSLKSGEPMLEEEREEHEPIPRPFLAFSINRNFFSKTNLKIL